MGGIMAAWNRSVRTGGGWLHRRRQEDVHARPGGSGGRWKMEPEYRAVEARPKRSRDLATELDFGK
ncbi:hypothetical protein WAI453_008647 [Rhynchosporium graminicola]